MQKVLLRFRSVRFFRLRGIRRNVLPKFIELEAGVEGLNVINDPKCNKVLNVVTFCPKCNNNLP